jgi:integrase
MDQRPPAFAETALYDVLGAAEDLAQVRRFGLHGLRHLYCSLLQDSGASLKFAQERLGHANAATTADIYTHNISNHGKEFAEKVEAAFPFASVSLTLAKPVAVPTQPEIRN